MFANLVNAVRQASLQNDWKAVQFHFYRDRGPVELQVSYTTEDGSELAKSVALSERGNIWGPRPELAIPVDAGRKLWAGRREKEPCMAVVYCIAR